MYRIINNSIIEVPQTSITFTKVPGLNAPVAEVDVNSRNLNIRYSEGHLNTQLPYSVISESELTFEGTLLTFGDNVKINGVRYYKLTPDIINLTQLLTTEVNDSVIKKNDTLYVLIKTQTITFSQYQALLLNNGYLYPKLVGTFVLANFNSVELNQSINKVFASRFIYSRNKTFVLDEPKITAHFIRELKARYPDIEFYPVIDKTPTNTKFFTYKSRMLDVGGSLHLVTGPNFEAIHYTQIQVRLQFCSQDIRDVMEFRLNYLSDKEITTLSHYTIPVIMDSTMNVSVAVNWDRDSVSDSIVESSPDTKVDIKLPTFDFQARLTAPIILGSDTYMNSILDYILEITELSGGNE